MKADVSTASDLRDLQQFQFRRKIALALSGTSATAALLFCSSFWHNETRTDLIIRYLGATLIFASIAGRTWCALYIGGKKKTTLVQEGPYSLVRHPLYLFSIIGALGAGAQWGTIVVSLALAAITTAILYEAIRKEEAFMSRVYGHAYADYCERVSRFVPHMGTWRDIDELNPKPWVVVRTFRDACLFLLAIPIARGIDWAQQNGHLPILLSLP